MISCSLEIIPSEHLSGLHCHIIIYIFISHNLTLPSSLRRRIGEFVPIYIVFQMQIIYEFVYKYMYAFLGLANPSIIRTSIVISLFKE